MRRSGSLTAAPPRSGDSFSSNGSYKRSKRVKRRKQVIHWAFILRILLVIAGLLSALDVVLFWKSRAHNQHSTPSHPLEEHEGHVVVEREPPRPVNGDGDDATISDEDLDADKEPIYEILLQARIDPSSLTNDEKRRLPTWSTVQRLYGDHPRIHGLDTCEHFREITEPSLTFLAMAGTFNSGTNLLASLMIRNCQIDERMKVYGEKQKGMRWQVKWVSE